MHQGDPTFHDWINLWIEEMGLSGEFEALREKWMQTWGIHSNLWDLTMKIAIVGAGIGGLTLAARLKQKTPKISAALYERDKSAFSRPQGYAIGIKGDSGLPVLCGLGLYEQVISGNTVKVTSFTFTGQAGNILFSLPSRDEKHLTYRVQRRHLREVLLQAIGDTPIYCGRTCEGYNVETNGAKILFDDGSAAKADYLIACDGAASAIRQQMINDDKRYLGLTAISGHACVQINDPLLDGGYFMTLGDQGASMFVYRQPGGIRFSFTTHAAEGELTGRLPNDLLEIVKEHTKGWHKHIQEIIRAVDPHSLHVRGYYDKDPVKSVRDNRVWLLGDAAHPMCPFQGQGANTAMVDAIKIADFLVDLNKRGG